ncbi:MAG: Na/Pi symporter [Pseudomonadota bacterium]|nr:Na/Pi symporter [Pseudomonadota bacterium]
MFDLALIGGLLGGVGLFLLGMQMMTDGLKVAAGPALERILASSTKTRLRGLMSGTAITMLVQSSSAVTVAVIGFVNAGLLTFAQSVWVLFGANVGTSMTGWLVALVGLQFSIDLLALPLIGAGMVMKLLGGTRRLGSFGVALAGFGLLFLGIDLLRETFTGVAGALRLPSGDGLIGSLLLVGVGIVLTVLMQSSSASLTVALTATQGGLLDAQGAAAVVIGANVGTTVTALLASIGATPNAKRAAAAHITFNVLTGVVALILLPWLVPALGALGDRLALGGSPAGKLALFHTAFNVLGVILIWPLAGRLVAMLEARFREREADERLPQYLDSTTLEVPALALDALGREIRAVAAIVQRSLAAALQPDGAGLAAVERDLGLVQARTQAVSHFITELNRAGMSEQDAERLPQLLRASRHQVQAMEAIADAIHDAALLHAPTPMPAAWDELEQSGQQLQSALHQAMESGRGEALQAAWQGALDQYQQFKRRVLLAGVQGALEIERMDALLRTASHLRRAADQSVKAARLLLADAAR